MRKMRVLLGAVLFFLLSSFQVEAAVFQPESYTLANGAQLVVVPNELSPAVALMVWYRVGRVDEEAGHSGLAHYLEHLMFRGSSAGHSKAIASGGGEDNAFTSYDYTGYHEIVAADHLAEAMQLEANRMAALSLSEDEAKAELAVVLNERHERTDNAPEGVFSEKMRAMLFPEHVYGIPVIGHREEIERLTLDEVRAFHAKHYAPQNAVIVVSGGIKSSEALRVAAATFGRVPMREAIAPIAISPSAEPKEKRFVMADARVQQPFLVWQFVVPSFGTTRGKTPYEIEVLREVLDAERTGVFYRDLVVTQKIASAIQVDYDPTARGEAVFSIVATPMPDVTDEALENALRDEVAHVAKAGFTAEDVAAAKKRLRRSAVFARDSLMAPCRVLGEALVVGQKINDVENWPERIGRVSTANVTADFRKMLLSKRQVVGMLEGQP